MRGGSRAEPTSAQGGGASGQDVDLAFTGKVVYYNTPEVLEAQTGIRIAEYNQSPMLDSMDLPPVAERLPENPLVVQPTTEIGVYGGTLKTAGDVRGDAETGFRGGLTREFVDGIANYIPDLFESFESNADGTVWTGRLRKGLRWSDGEPLTTADMVFALEDIIRDPDISPGGNSDWEDGAGNLPTLTVTDDINFTYTFAAPNNRFYYNIFRPWSSFIAPRHAMEQFHPKYNDEAIANSEDLAGITWMDTFGLAMEGQLEGFTPPSYTPWIRTEYIEGQLDVWERNPYFYWVDPAGNQLPYIDTIRWTPHSDINALILEAAAGDVDFVKGELIELGVNYTTVKEFERQGDYSLVPARGATMYYGAVYFNFDHPTDPNAAELFDHIEFRQALSLAMDREEISNTLFKGLGHPTQWAPIEAFKDDDPVYTNFTEPDVDRANKLLDELGYKWDRNREYRLYPDGSRITLSAMGETESIEIAIADMYAQQWRDIGIELVVRGFGNTGQKFEAMDYDLWIRQIDISEIEMSFPWSVYAEGPEEVFVASMWGRWLITNGDEGSEPPQYWKDAYAFTNASRSMPEDEMVAEAPQHFKSFAENLIILTNIAIPSQEGLDSKYLISNRVGNFPEVPSDQEATYMAGETFFIKPQ